MIGTKNLQNRQIWVENTLKSLPRGLKIIDVGAGECQYKVHCAHLDYVSQDFNQYNGVGDSNGLQTGEWDISQIDIVSDITCIPVNDESFDIVLCTEVLEHVPDPVSAINEMGRILKKNGIMIVTAPVCSLTHFAPYHYCDGFNKYFYEFHFKRLGFSISELKANGNYFEYLAQELYRLPNVFGKFTGSKSIIIKSLCWLLLKALNIMTNKSIGSEELVCYGYHVVAKKS
jgi:ubiquinone/menaquinone biosynthesis C-methylase UbiE